MTTGWRQQHRPHYLRSQVYLYLARINTCAFVTGWHQQPLKPAWSIINEHHLGQAHVPQGQQKHGIHGRLAHQRSSCSLQLSMQKRRHPGGNDYANPACALSQARTI